MTDLPNIGVVVPGYGHPQFLAEALQSIAEQHDVGTVKTVVVDDGCRFTETSDVASSFMQDGSVFFVRQPNKRLPGARNTGVRFLLDLDPALDAVFFLDADNRLSPYSLAAYSKILFGADGIGWAYPDIYFFGLNGGQMGFDIRITANRYSGLKHLMGNISEAGSLVRADVFRQGLFYNEDMTSGFEDWDFWLTLLEAGYTGARVSDSGFFYRRRPESMLAESRRLEEALLLRLQQQHSALFEPRALMRRAHQEAPSYALYQADDTVRLFTDPLENPGITCALSEFVERFQSWCDNPRADFFPQALLTIDRGIWTHLESRPQLLRWLLWTLHESCADTPTLIELADGEKVTIIQGGSVDSVESTHIAWYPIGSLRQWLETGQPPDVRAAIATLPAGDVPMGRIDDAAQDWLADIIEQTKVRTLFHHRESRFAGPDAQALNTVLLEPLCASEGRVPFPVATPGQRLILAVRQEEVMQATTFDRLLKFALMCQQIDTDLVLLLEYEDAFCPRAVLKSELAEKVVDLMGLRRHRRMGNAPLYLGRRLTQYQTDVEREHGTVLVKAADILVSMGTASLANYFGEAKLSGITGYMWLPDGIPQPGEAADLLLSGATAFEHALAGLIGPVENLRPIAAAEGIPPAKVISMEQFMKVLSFSAAD